MINYSQFPGLAGVHLEDSYVLAISDMPGQLTFKLEAVLTPENPAYHTPNPGEHHCYAAGNLVFGDVTRLDWIKGSHSQFTDATGEVDLGNIDILRVDGDAVVADGDWGEVRIVSAQPRFELGG